MKDVLDVPGEAVDAPKSDPELRPGDDGPDVFIDRICSVRLRQSLQALVDSADEAGRVAAQTAALAVLASSCPNHARDLDLVGSEQSAAAWDLAAVVEEGHFVVDGDDLLVTDDTRDVLRQLRWRSDSFDVGAAEGSPGADDARLEARSPHLKPPSDGA